MVGNKGKNLVYSIPILLAFFFVIGLLITSIHSQQGLISIEYRFWSTFSLISVSLMLFSIAILDLKDKRGKESQRDSISQRIRSFKIKNINIIKLAHIGISIEAILTFLLFYLYFLAPIEMIEYLFTLNSPFFIFIVTLAAFGVFLIITGYLFLAIKIKKKKEPTERVPRWEIKEFISRGLGTESDPAIIEPSEDLPGMIRLDYSNRFIIIQNCYLDQIFLDSCQNVKIENCNVWSISLPYCSNISLIKSTIRRTLTFCESENIKTEECTINRLKIRLSNSNIIRNSSIKKVKFITGHDNVLEANTIPEKHLNKIKKSYWYDWYKLKII